ncbi:14459_t:CDS:10, partial [Dentiscutata erythropus]
DDRTGQVIKNRIKDALETQSVFNKKPNLIIIDEIDGVSSSGDENFVKLLLDLVDGEKQSSRDVNQLMSKGAKTSKKRKAVKRSLLRPIICICNDQYTAALRPLKASAKIVNYKRMQSNRLAKRLKEICDREKLSADVSTLFVLAESAEGDIRNCLTTLQFIKQGSNIVTRELILNASIGQKDTNKSLFTIWEEIFQVRSSKVRSHDSVVARDSENNANRYISRLESLISTNGEYERLMQGCFENYLKYNFHDQKFKLSQINEWINFYDQINHRTNSMQLFGLSAYLPYPIINFHRFFSGVSHPRIEYPRKDYECYIQQQANENKISSALNGMKAKYRLTLKRNIFITEFGSFLLQQVEKQMFERPKTNMELDKESRKSGKEGDSLIKPELDFFGRPKANMELDKESRKSGKEGDSLVKPEVWYRYHEGSSKAVRTKMKLQDFF